MNADFDYNNVGAGYYDALLDVPGGIRKFWHVEKFERIRQAASALRPQSILDVGCAAGSFLGRFAPSCERALGIDISKTQIEYAQRRYAGPTTGFLAADVRLLDLDACFDLVVMSEVVEHLARAEAVETLARLRRFLKPDGRLLVTTPNYRSLWPLLEFCVNRLSPVSYEHQHLNKLDRKRFVELLGEAGYIAERVETFFLTAPFFAKLPYGMARRIGKLERRLCPHAGSILLAVCRAA